MNLREQVPLAPLTTLGVGGPARYFVEADSEADVREALQFAKERDLPLFVLGGGSNLVVADADLTDWCSRFACAGIDRIAEGRTSRFRLPRARIGTPSSLAPWRTIAPELSA